MYKYFRVYELGFCEGFKDAVKDFERKSFNEINIMDIMSKLYDIGYIDILQCLFRPNFSRRRDIRFGA